MVKGKETSYTVSVVDGDGNQCCWWWWWLEHKGTTTTFLIVGLFVVLVRAAVSLHSYSGFANPPKFGDYEAQRHWMEITINLPIQEWYRNSTSNDLSYWGLDYPPLTAYQSFIHGLFLGFVHPESVSLVTSRGHESYLGKLLMRWTVLSFDLLIFFPAVLYFVIVRYGQPSRSRKSDIGWHIAMLLLNPCLILIDHGHFQVCSVLTLTVICVVFQYNCISLGFTIGAVAGVLSGKDLVACVLYCLALNHKQVLISDLSMGLFVINFFYCFQLLYIVYHVLELLNPVQVELSLESWVHLLGKCLRHKHPLFEVSKLGFYVLGTFAAVWWPYLYSKDSILEVLSRLAPFERGIFEDYVANFWCASSIIIKWKRLFTSESLRLLSLIATVITCLPSIDQ
ncbi:hypothetical protein HN51_040114 [Arachis hypogaea]